MYSFIYLIYTLRRE